ncbi:hypothetical protein GWI33_008559 [Rhynchophorus ferrugineus]|uniref:Transmembrane protein 231 n=1 Tax=Rhynchophorus ferrugineus TaxID=354439 RepID=A0A834IEN1_RHYFE|nr:hypothetical protein GWI33_008559 [Rhynchophorus ferrugineus]
MVVLEVHTECIKTKYKAFLLSKATLVILICNLITIVLPFVLAYNTGGFWLKQDVIYEQPEIQFKGQYLLVVTFDDPDKPIVCGSFSFYKDNLNYLDKCTMIQVSDSDEDNDGKTDKLEINFKTDIYKNAIMSSIYLVIPLKLKLNTPCLCYIETTLIHQQLPIKKATNINVFADFKLKQLDPIKCPKYGSIQYDHSIINEGLSPDFYELHKIIEKYSEARVKVTLENVLTSYISTEESGAIISLKIKYPKQKIYYKPSFWHIIKYAWIQYLALYIVISWIIHQIKNYIFNNNLVLIYKDKYK